MIVNDGSRPDLLKCSDNFAESSEISVNSSLVSVETAALCGGKRPRRARVVTGSTFRFGSKIKWVGGFEETNVFSD